MLVDADGEEADDVFVEALLPLDLGDRGGRRIDVEEREVRLAVLLDAVGEGLQAPRLDLGDLAAGALDDALELLDKRLDLLGRHILSRHEYVFVQRHLMPFLVFAGAKPRRSP